MDTDQSYLCVTALQSRALNHLISIIGLVGSHGIVHYASFIHRYMFPEKQRVVHHGTCLGFDITFHVIFTTTSKNAHDIMFI